MANTSIRPLRYTVVIALVFVLAGCSAEPPPPEVSASPLYLALGDSLAVGVGANDWATGGYVPRLLERLNVRRPDGSQLELANVSRSGADTRTLIEDGQLAEAIGVIEAARETATTADDVQVITIGIGGNDGFGLVTTCGRVVDDACLRIAQERIREVRKNLLFIVRSLRDAAGPEARIAVMTYYNPLAHEGCPLHEFEPIADVVLEGQAELGIETGLNDEIRSAAEAAGVLVAEVGDLDVAELTGDCLHASDAGHARIAAAFQAVLGS